MNALHFRGRTIERVMRHREVMRACMHAARVVAPFCPPADVEAYVRACTRADRQERRYDALIGIISAFVTPAFLLVGSAPFALLGAAVFVALWAAFGIGECMEHKAELHAAAVAKATAKLCEAVTWTPEEMAARGVTLKIIHRKYRP